MTDRVRAALESLGLIAAWDAAEMLVSEVATNAVLHARTEFTVDVAQHDDRVRALSLGQEDIDHLGW